MELSRLQTLLTAEDKNALYQGVTGTVSDKKQASIKDYINQYQPNQHRIVTDLAYKPDKIIGTTTITYAKLPIPFQKLIVNRRAAFLCANALTLSATPKNDAQKNFLALIQKVWDDNKLDYDTLELAKMMMSETECAEIWYAEKVDGDYWKDTAIPQAQFTLRMRIIAPSLGDELYPVFDSTGNMIAFGRGYVLLNDEGKEEKHFDIYTAEKLYKGVQGNSQWTFDEETNVVKKIPVIYYSQPEPEWMDVQRLIEDYEESAGNHSDTNKRLGNPSYKVRGEVSGFETDLGLPKVYNLKGQDADISLLSWDKSPESVALQQKNTRSWILDFTDTPDISFEQLKGLGDISGAALDRMLISAYLGAIAKEKVFGKSVQRRLNLMKAALVEIALTLKDSLSLVIKPVFNLYRIQDIAADIDLLITATQGGILSKETAVSKNPLVEDAEAELEKIRKEGETTDKKIDGEMNNEGGGNAGQ